MSNNDLWLRKIAAFLHDPPDKGFWHEFRDVDALRFWFWIIAPKRDEPFYFSKLKPRKKESSGDLSALEKCFTQKWDDFLNALLARKFGLDNIPEICGASYKRFLAKDKKGITNHFKRLFHFVASSQIRIHLFGFEYEGSDVSQVSLLHPLDEFSWMNVIELANEFQKEFNKENLRNELAEYFTFLANIADEFKRFLTLWRKRHWISTISPADTRIPDHPVIDLEIMESAIAATLEEESEKNGNGIDEESNGTNKDVKKTYEPHPSFLILEFRPVQKFIANARKMRDLWFSSWLISYLAWKAMKPIAEELGPDNIIYPDLYKQPLVDDWLKGLEIKDIPEPNLRMPTLPNTFLAIVPEGQEKKFAEKSQQALKGAWDEIVDGVYDLLMSAGMLEKGSPLEREFKRQTENFPFDIYWLGLKWGTEPEKAIEDYKNFITPGNGWEFGELWDKISEKVKNPNIGDTYALLIEMAQTGLKALKYRGKPETVNEPGHKCSLCGERTALTYEDTNNINEIKDFWKELSEKFPGHIKENEHLCAVCLVKRLAPKAIYESIKENAKNNQRSPFFESIVREFDYHYPSTGSIALAPFIEKAIKAKKKNLPEVQWKIISDKIYEIKKEKDGLKFLEKYILHGRSVPKVSQHFSEDLEFLREFEPEWLYPETPDREVIEPERHEGKQIFTPFAEELKDAIKSALGEFAEKVRRPRYYAAVYLDGDDLGKWLRGEFAPKIEDVFHPDFAKQVMNNEHFKKIKDLKRPVTPAIHRAISSALRDFALEVVPYVVEHYLGVVIYSGGDDTLFLMPLENLLETLKALRKLYSGEKYNGEFNGRRFESDKGFIKIYENGKLKEIIRVMGTKATLSAGVAIAHYLDPLDVTLAKAKKALKEAKKHCRMVKNKDEAEKAKEKAKRKDAVGFKLLLHSGSERSSVIPWEFIDSMDEFRDAIIDKKFSSRFLRILCRDIQIFNELEDAFDKEFFKFGKRGQSNTDFAEAFLHGLTKTREALKIKPETFLDALLISEFIVREEGKK